MSLVKVFGSNQDGSNRAEISDSSGQFESSQANIKSGQVDSG